MTQSRTLPTLCSDLLASPPPPIEIRHLALDSRRVEPDGLFLACAGRRTHGLARLEEACARGARAVLWEPAAGVPEPQPRDGVFMAPVAELSRHASQIAGRFFGDPSSQMAVIGITGTNGKTTSSWLLADALNKLGQRTAYLGTLGSGIPGEVLQSAEYTTEDAVALQQRLFELRQLGAECIAMEVSSHALDQQRAAAVQFRIAAFTNLTRDHLDYHGSMAAYGAAKARLFEMPALAHRVFNVDDVFGAELALRYAHEAEPAAVLWLVARQTDGRAVIERCRHGAATVNAVCARDVQRTAHGLVFELEDATQDCSRVTLELPLIGEFNVDNALLAYASLRALGVAGADACAALRASRAPAGRMQTLPVIGHGLAIVDYAHTPDALVKALRAARGHCRGRLHLVFGCGGDRDAGKRSVMGRVAAEMADRVVLTDDNPRTEAAAAIIADIRAGIEGDVEVLVIHDRAAAITQTLQAAAVDDVVLIAGKGHEQYQLVGTERRPFSDSAVVQQFIATAGSAA